MFLKSSLQVHAEMRTNKKQKEQRSRVTAMLNQIKLAARESRETLLGDFIGAAALMVTLVGGLYLPGLL